MRSVGVHGGLERGVELRRNAKRIPAMDMPLTPIKASHSRVRLNGASVGPYATSESEKSDHTVQVVVPYGTSLELSAKKSVLPQLEGVLRCLNRTLSGLQCGAQFDRIVPLVGYFFILASATPISVHAQAYDCVIEPYTTVKLASSVEGVVARLDVNRGDLVSKGQVIGKLDDALEEAEVALAATRAGNDFTIKTNKARQEFMQRKLARNEKLKATDAVADSKLEEAITEARVADLARQEAELAQRVARLELRRAEEALSRRTFRSPIDGIIVERVLSPGEYRHAQSHIVTIAQIDPLRVEVFLPTSAYGRIRAGSRAVVQPQQPVGGTYPGTIVVIDKVLDAASGTFGVRLEIPNPGNQLPAGLRCTVTFETKEAAAD